MIREITTTVAALELCRLQYFSEQLSLAQFDPSANLNHLLGAYWFRGKNELSAK